ncbi:MAG TPA: VOC family protein [Candidatus Dormibacteraeota bacterium]|nr:VOC family protein [Candidatus Dormibacteraeota bacterium]
MNDTTTTTAPTVWPALRYDDARAAIRFLVTAFGFEERLVVPGEGDRDIVHAELRWPLGGGIMLGSTSHTEGIHEQMRPGVGWVYVVTDGPDALLERAVAAGAEVTQGLRDEDYGSRGFSVRDPEGNHWSFGTYRGA